MLSELGQQVKMVVAGFDFHAMSECARGDEQVGGRNSQALASGTPRQLQTKRPHIRIGFEIYHVAVKFAKQLSIPFTAGSIPEFEPNHIAPRGLIAQEQVSNPPLHFRFAPNS